MIPDPWFKAQSREFTIEMGLRYAGNDHRKLENGERRCASFVLPSFQRDAVWTEQQNERLIESMWMGLPIGVYVFNRDDDEPYRFDCWLLDGQQRWGAIVGYVNNCFVVYGSYFGSLAAIERRRFLGKTFTGLETRLTDLGQLLDVYDRLAYGGTPHEPRP